MRNHLCNRAHRWHVLDRHGDVEAVLEFGHELEDLERIEAKIGDEIARERRLDGPAADALQRLDHARFDVSGPGTGHGWERKNSMRE